jgi:hypothetical protein
VHVADTHTAYTDIDTLIRVLDAAETMPAARQTGAINGHEAENWVDEQTRRAQDDRLLVAIPMFLAAATALTSWARHEPVAGAAPVRRPGRDGLQPGEDGL